MIKNVIILIIICTVIGLCFLSGVSHAATETPPGFFPLESARPQAKGPYKLQPPQRFFQLNQNRARYIKNAPMPSVTKATDDFLPPPNKQGMPALKPRPKDAAPMNAEAARQILSIYSNAN